MGKTQIKFLELENETICYLLFPNSKRSTYLKTKEEAIKAINRWFQKKRFSEEERDELIKDVLWADELPSILILNPFVVICNCGLYLRHGHILDNKDQKVTKPFFSRNEGRRHAAELFENFKIDEFSLDQLNFLIDILPLPQDIREN
ncbi:MAG: hypothetical protein M3P22_00105 [bacterium]|nr:hypothetical protein [bacterium]